MDNFSFYNPVEIVLGRGSIAQLRRLVPPDSKVMLVYGGGSINANGVYQQVLEALADYEVVEFSGIEPNPRFETCMMAVKLARAEGAEFLLAVGGGSVLDATKFIAAAVVYEGDEAWDIVTSRGGVVAGALPLGCVLTLPATGSEANKIAVISREATQEKLAFLHPSIFPRFSILDPETTYSLPDRQIRNGIVDVFCHIMEQYMTYPAAAPLQDRQAEALAATVVELAPKLLAEKLDYESRAAFMWCAAQALNGLIGCGVPQDWSSHMIGHELTAFYGLDHAQSLAIVMPNVWRHEKDVKSAKLAQLAERVWRVAEGDESAKADAAVDMTVAFFRSVGMPTSLGEYDIPGEAADKIADRFASRDKVVGEHLKIGADEVREILNACM